VTDGRTDGQTDGIAMAYTCYSIYAVARKNGVSGSFNFHKSKLQFIYINLLPLSAFEDPFSHFHSMFQQFNSSLRSTLN